MRSKAVRTGREKPRTIRRKRRTDREILKRAARKKPKKAMAKGKKTGGRDFVKGDPRAGRPRDTEESRMKKRAFRERLKEYLESGEAEEDFQRLRKKFPGSALEMALDRIEGRPKQSIEHSGAFALVVKGKDA